MGPLISHFYLTNENEIILVFLIFLFGAHFVNLLRYFFIILFGFSILLFILPLVLIKRYQISFSCLGFTLTTFYFYCFARCN